MAKRNAALNALRAQIDKIKGEAAARNHVQRELGAHGYRKRPSEVLSARVDGRTVRVYVWLDTPFGGDIALVAGPSIVAEVDLTANMQGDPKAHATVPMVTAELTDAAKAALDRAKARGERAAAATDAPEPKRAPAKRRTRARKPAQPAMVAEPVRLAEVTRVDDVVAPAAPAAPAPSSANADLELARALAAMMDGA